MQSLLHVGVLVIEVEQRNYITSLNLGDSQADARKDIVAHSIAGQDVARAWREGVAMRISRASAYAIGAVLQLAEAPEGVPVPCSRLAKTGEMPERFLLQVLRNLVNHGILKSTRGVDGGYSLQRPIGEITLLQILESTDGSSAAEVPPLECISQASREKLQAILRDITAVTCRNLSEVSVAELMTSSSGSGVPDKPIPNQEAL